ncbi:2714_t:CDS:2 [Acaulospora morrowiae]|uniref:2714_t:CDS:1 n=1 Tax=Acaulospora morrowiae TaxID=94023 RepID=A0A9N9FDG9_9GLOM|nr:2714_t:CDS:2 [Acaulospora morrowiae]
MIPISTGNTLTETTETISPQESNDRVSSKNWVEMTENEKFVTWLYSGMKGKHDDQTYQSTNQRLRTG